jgi:predicted nucleic acid-binding protein
MARVRKIQRIPSGKNYYVIDACFLVNKFIPIDIAPDNHQKKRISDCMDWWAEIDTQLKAGRARIYIPDICIAEAFKVLAQKYYTDKWFKTAPQYNYWRKKLRETISNRDNKIRKYSREILYHDISTSRDIIISVDRFFELFLKEKLKASLPDLIILATAKYLIDFYDIPKDSLHIITMDNALRDGSKKSQDLPNAYDPTKPEDECSRIFIDPPKTPAKGSVP